MAFVLVVPASAAPLRLPTGSVRLLPPVSSASSSEASSASSVSTSSASSIPAMSVKKQKMTNKLNASDDHLRQYCDAISVALSKRAKVQGDEETLLKADQAFDFLKKAEAICSSILPPHITFQEGSFSSSSAPVFAEGGSLSSSSASLILESGSQFCSVTGKVAKRRGVDYCRFDCGGKAKIMPCA